MVKYFLGQSVLRSSWDQVFAAFWQRYPNPYRYVVVGRASRPPLSIWLSLNSGAVKDWNRKSDVSYLR